MTQLKGQEEAVLNKLNGPVGAELPPLPLYYWVTGLGAFKVMTLEG